MYNSIFVKRCEILGTPIDVEKNEALESLQNQDRRLSPQDSWIGGGMIYRFCRGYIDVMKALHKSSEWEESGNWHRGWEGGSKTRFWLLGTGMLKCPDLGKEVMLNLMREMYK
jgi:hypothetical protein